MAVWANQLKIFQPVVIFVPISMVNLQYFIFIVGAKFAIFTSFF